MVPNDLAVLRSLIAMAWADGKVAEEETALIDSLIESFGADKQETNEFKVFAAEPRTLNDIPLEELDAGSRRRLLQLAVLVSFVDGQQDETELALLHDLSRRLEIPEEERNSLLHGSAMRARGLLKVLQA